MKTIEERVGDIEGLERRVKKLEETSREVRRLIAVGKRRASVGEGPDMRDLLDRIERVLPSPP
jgi:hypothetical protein